MALPILHVDLLVEMKILFRHLGIDNVLALVHITEVRCPIGQILHISFLLLGVSLLDRVEPQICYI